MTGIVEELDNGVVIHRATDEPEDACNIYCESCYCSADSSCFVYLRSSRDGEQIRHEYVACDFDTWKTRVIAPHTEHPSGAVMSHDGQLYYKRRVTDGRVVVARVDPLTGQSRTIALPEQVPPHGRLVVCPHERYVAYHVAVSYSPQMFAIDLLDLQTGRIERLCEDPYLCNTHHQFEPKEGKWLMVQHNRGCRFTEDGKLLALAGPEGATLFFVEVPGGRVVTPKIAPPHTYGISGHETWLGTSGEAIITLNVSGDYDRGKGPILAARPDGAIREVCAPHQANHIGVDRAGRLFATDSYCPDEIAVGSAKTNRMATVCAARSAYARDYDRPEEYLTDHHPHPYVSPDLKWVLFNSDRQGVQQVYAARLPEEMVAELTDEG